MMRFIAVAAVFLAVSLCGCKDKAHDGKILEMQFSSVKAEDPVAGQTPELLKALEALKSSDAKMDKVSKDANIDAGVIEPSVAFVSFTKILSGTLMTIRAEGSNWCGTMGCNTDFYLAKDGKTYAPIGSVSFNRPAYTLSCDGKDFVLFESEEEKSYIVWAVTKFELQLTGKYIPLKSKAP